MIKTIVVPTDFSMHADFAVDAANKIASFFNARCHIVHIIEPPNFERHLISEAQLNNIYDHATDRAKTLFDSCKNKSLLPTDQIDFITLYGDYKAQITNYIESVDADLVLIGAHGTSGKREYFYGSNTQKIIRSLHVPALIIKEQMDQFPFKNIVYVSDFKEEEINPYLRFLSIIKPFNPTIHLLHIDLIRPFGLPRKVTDFAMIEFKKLANPLSVEINHYKDFSVDAGARRVGDLMDADLIAISNYNRHPIKRIFSGSNVEALVNHSDIPVLSIDYKNN